MVLGKKIKEVVSEISSRYKYVSGAKGKKEKIIRNNLIFHHRETKTFGPFIIFNIIWL